MHNVYDIAIVDDQEMTRITLGLLLERRLDANVSIKAESGEQLLEMIKKGKVPDLVITDLAMPEMGGVTLCRKLKKQFPGLKILVFSIYDEQPVIDRLYEMGVDAYVHKDVILDDLIQSVKNMLNGKPGNKVDPLKPSDDHFHQLY